MIAGERRDPSGSFHLADPVAVRVRDIDIARAVSGDAFHVIEQRLRRRTAVAERSAAREGVNGVPDLGVEPPDGESEHTDP